MVTAKKSPARDSTPIPVTKPSSSPNRARPLVVGLGLAVTVISLIMALSKTPMNPAAVWSLAFSKAAKETGSPETSARPVNPVARLTRERIDILLGALDQAYRRKDVEGVLRHIDSNATITIHMKQGSQHQTAVLTPDEYRTTLRMGFAFPSANDYTRVSTTVSLAPDERSAKVSVKSTQTLRHARRDLKIEGEETLIFKLVDDRPVIVSLDQIVPGDST